jgi:hypothetical protein
MRESRTSGSGRGDQGNLVPYRHVRRETGKEQMVRVHYDEGVANHIGLESCAGGREAVREALTGECAGQPLSHGAPGDRQEVEGESPLR